MHHGMQTHMFKIVEGQVDVLGLIEERSTHSSLTYSLRPAMRNNYIRLYNARYNITTWHASTLNLSHTSDSPSQVHQV